MNTESWDYDNYDKDSDSFDDSGDFDSEDDLYDFCEQFAPSKVERLVNIRFMIYKYIKPPIISEFFY